MVDLTGLLTEWVGEVLNPAIVKTDHDGVELVVGHEKGQVMPEIASEHPLAAEQDLCLPDIYSREGAIRLGDRKAEHLREE